MPFLTSKCQLGKNRPHYFNGLEKTYLELKFEVIISKNKETGQQYSFQKVWKIALLTEGEGDLIKSRLHLKIFSILKNDEFDENCHYFLHFF